MLATYVSFCRHITFSFDLKKIVIVLLAWIKLLFLRPILSLFKGVFKHAEELLVISYSIYYFVSKLHAGALLAFHHMRSLFHITISERLLSS